MNTTNIHTKEIQELLDLIQTCELGVAKLKTNPPSYLTSLEVEAYKTEFNNLGAKSLVEYYRLTSPMFSKG